MQSLELWFESIEKNRVTSCLHPLLQGLLIYSVIITTLQIW